MDTDRFDDVARAFGARSRRVVLGLTMGGLLGGLGMTASQAKKRKNKKKCKKKCSPCQSCKKGKCKLKPDDSSCRGSGKCLDGQCHPLPVCVQALQECPPESSTVDCCSGECANPPPPLLPACSFSGPGGLCVDSDDCGPGGTCVGYRCQTP